MGITLEICCGSLADVKAAARGGADRIELNSAFYLGGLTPSLGVAQLAKQACDLPIAAMVRPRGGGFCYTQDEYASMLRDSEILLKADMDAIVFGFLTAEKTLDVDRTRAFVQRIHSFGKEAVFHKAFDCIENQEEAICQLIALGVDRVLTSGGGKSAMEKADHLHHLIKTYGKEITILLGGGIRTGNVAQLLDLTGATQVHSSCGGYSEDYTVSGNGVSYAYRQDVAPHLYESVDTQQVRSIRQVLDGYQRK